MEDLSINADVVGGGQYIDLAFSEILRLYTHKHTS